MTIEEKRIVWNDAVRCCCNEIKTYDGIIPDAIDRNYMADKIKEKWSYKRIPSSSKRSPIIPEEIPKSSNNTKISNP